MYRIVVAVSSISIVLLCTMLTSGLAQPAVTRVTLDAPVNPLNYVVVFDSSPSGSGIWVNPGATTGSVSTSILPPAGPGGAGFTPVPARMHGLSAGYGQMLLSVSARTDDGGAEFGGELASLGSNLPTNANPDIFGGVQAPANKTNIELNRAIPAGTQVTFTVDLNGEIPHLVAIMGGSAPVVTYDPVGDSLTIQTTTFGTTTNANETFSSLVGFMVVTDTTLGTTPLRIIAQTNHWVGDIFPLLPGFDSNAAVPGNAGTVGTITAKCGTTIYGPTGETRTINIFIPDESLEAFFGAGTTPADIVPYVDTSVETGATINTGVSNFSTTGTQATFTYTFASPKDAGFGVNSSPLPVEFVSFSVAQQAEGVELSWQTATEESNLGFTVERRVKRATGDWQEIGFVSGHGTTIQPHDYSYFDDLTGLDAGTAFTLQYRLKQIDLDGSFKYHGPIEVHMGSAPETFTIAQNYPNPFNPATVIDFSVPKKANVSIVVYDILGRAIRTLVDRPMQQGVHSVVWDGKDDAGNPVAAGVYVYRLATSGVVETKKMILIK